jgi:hypothetical protein
MEEEQILPCRNRAPNIKWRDIVTVVDMNTTTLAERTIDEAFLFIRLKTGDFRDFDETFRVVYGE